MQNLDVSVLETMRKDKRKRVYKHYVDVFCYILQWIFGVVFGVCFFLLLFTIAGLIK